MTHRVKKRMPQTWLKVIGSAKEPIKDSYTKKYVGFRKANRRPGIRAGDDLFLYAAGGSKCIFALARALGDPERDPTFNPNIEGSCWWKLDIDYVINLPVKFGVPIGDVISRYADPTKSLRRASHIQLRPDESKLALSQLERAKKNSPNQSLQPTAGCSGD